MYTRSFSSKGQKLTRKCSLFRKLIDLCTFTKLEEKKIIWKEWVKEQWSAKNGKCKATANISISHWFRHFWVGCMCPAWHWIDCMFAVIEIFCPLNKNGHTEFNFVIDWLMSNALSNAHYTHYLFFIHTHWGWMGGKWVACKLTLVRFNNATKHQCVAKQTEWCRRLCDKIQCRMNWSL